MKKTSVGSQDNSQVLKAQVIRFHRDRKEQDDVLSPEEPAKLGFFFFPEGRESWRPARGSHMNKHTEVTSSEPAPECPALLPINVAIDLCCKVASFTFYVCGVLYKAGPRQDSEVDCHVACLFAPASHPANLPPRHSSTT